ncbi:MAG: DUF3180 domain-containing protein [Bifidobacteriaceae bacterium]|jgi:hypothetical protein|nr:DUF3180 domain-containing protein [Bifidobacteriaceae bacterium]MCI1978699.1 DUF3180 domain-containing protein [Bifidobacteriaceae bacterium]
MKARKTPWQYFVIAGVVGLLGGATLAYVTRNSAVNVLGSSWVVPVILGLLGILVLVLAWTVRKYAKGELKDIDPRRAFNTLVMAKSLSLAGSLLAGWYLGQLLVVLPRGDAPYYSEVILECAVSAGVSLFDVIAGIVSEWWCQLPPNEGPEHEKMKRRKRMLDASASQKRSSSEQQTKPINTLSEPREGHRYDGDRRRS